MPVDNYKERRKTERNREKIRAKDFFFKCRTLLYILNYRFNFIEFKLYIV